MCAFRCCTSFSVLSMAAFYWLSESAMVLYCVKTGAAARSPSAIEIRQKR